MYEEEKWGYCTNQDSRFAVEIKEGVPKEGPLVYETSVKRNIGKLPPECFDTIDGYLDPKSYIIRSYRDGNEVRRPDVKERTWIIQNCRVGEGTAEEIATGGQAEASEGQAGIHPIHMPAEQQGGRALNN